MSRENTAAETLGNVWQSKEVKTRGISVYKGVPMISESKSSCFVETRRNNVQVHGI